MSAIQRAPVKARKVGDQERRRREALERQAAARRNLTDHARDLALAGDDGSDDVSGGEAAPMESEGGAGRKTRRVRTREARTAITLKRRRYWSQQFCTPEWMLEVPADLNGKDMPASHGWYVMARPEGRRVLVIAARGRTIARDMSGAVVQRWASELPGGSPGISGGGGPSSSGYTILDCVYHELDQSFYLLDMLCWKGYSLYDCTADFRLYWVRTKLTEALAESGPAALAPINGPGAPSFPIVPLPYFECDVDGLRKAYRGAVSYIRDGLLFYDKAGHYSLGVTPLVLIWKDEATTRYLMQPGPQSAVLAVASPAAAVATAAAESAGTAAGNGDVVVVVAASGSSKGNCAAADAPGMDVDDGGDGDVRNGDGAASSRFTGPLRLLTSDGREVETPGSEAWWEGCGSERPMLGDLVRFSLDSVAEEMPIAAGTAAAPAATATAIGQQQQQAPARAVVRGLRYQRTCGPMRPAADSWSKVLFQARVHSGRGGVSLADLLAVAAGARGSGGGE